MAGPGEQIGSAHVSVGADNDPLRRELAETEALINESFRRMDRVRARPEVEAETREVMQDIAEVRAALLYLDQAEAEVEVDLDDSPFQAKRKQFERQLKELQQRKLELAVETRHLTDADRLATRLNKTLSDQEAAAKRVENQFHKNATAVAKLRERYAALDAQIRKISGKTLISGGDRLHLERLNAELAETEHRLRGLGSTVDDIDTKVDRHNATLIGWFRSISNIRIHMGIMSLTIVQFFRAVTLLGPILEGVGGALSAMVGSLGAGVMGAAAIGGAAITAFGITVIGLTQAVQPAMAELDNLQSAFEDVREAEQEYGRGSKEAAEAQRELNRMLKNSDPQVARFASSLNAMGRQWERLTGPTRRDFFGMMADGARGLQTMLPMLASHLNRTMQVAREGAQEWIATFTGPQATNAIDNMLGNFTDALPSFMRGLEHLGMALLNTFSEVSNHAESLGRGFADWGLSIRRATEAADFGQRVDGWISSMREWGHLLQSTGRLLATFFGAGREEGENLTRTLTGTFNRWSDWMQTMEGKNSLADFFARSSTMAQQFFSTLAPVVEILFTIAQITAPITQAILGIVRAIANVVTAITSIDGARQILSAFATAVAGAFVVGRIFAFVGAIRTAMVTLGLLRGVTPMAAGIAASMGGMAAGAGRATVATAGFKGALGGLLARINPVAAGLTALGTAAFIAAKASEERDRRVAATRRTLGVTNETLSDSIYLETELGKSFEEQAEALRRRDRAMQGIPERLHQAEQATRDLKAAEQAYQEAVDKYGRRSEQAYRALFRVGEERERQAVDQQRAAEKVSRAWQSQNDAVAAARDTLAAANKELRESSRRASEGPGVALRGVPPHLLDETQDLTDELDTQADAELLLNQAQNERAATLVNLGRIMAGVQPVTERASQAVGEFARTFRGVPAARRLLIATNSRQATGELAQVANQARNLAGRRSVVRILADSGSAQEAIARLNNLVQRVTQRDWKILLGIVDRVSAPLSGIANRLRNVLGQDYTANVKADVRDALGNVADAAKALVGVEGNYSASVSANVGSALANISSVVSALAAVRSKTVTITTIAQQINRGASRYAGGPLVPGFAKGADQRMIERAHRQADQREPRTPRGGMRVTRPTYITGEESGHNEYVIATNPAYRASNRRYLQAAASDLGMMVVDGFAKGGVPKRYRKGPMFGPRSGYEQLKHEIQLSESLFSNMQRQHEEQLALGARYPMPTLETLVGQKESSIKTTDWLVDHIREYLVPRLQRQIKRDPKFHRRKKPGRRPGEKAKDYQDRVKEWHREEKQRKKQHTQRERDKDRTRRDQIPELLREAQDLGQSRYNLVLDLEALKRGDVGSGGGGAGPTLEEQFASFNQARYDLFKTFGSNVAGIAAGFGTTGASGFAVAGAVGGGGGGGTVSPRAGANGGDAGATGGTVTNNFTNNFAAPPPDPHTWAQDMAFEAGAYA